MSKVSQFWKIIILIVVLIIIGLVWSKTLGKSTPKVTYQTTQVTKGTLITSVSASGTVSAGNSVDLTTQASGVVSNVYVKSGDTVTVGEKVADLQLDQASLQKQTSAWASYLQAKAGLDSANNNLNTLQNTEFVANQKLINDAVARGLLTTDPTYIEENATWQAAQQSYINQQTVIAQAQTALSAAWLAYQQTSAEIISPAAGTITNLTLTPGFPVSSSSNSSSSTSTTTAQKLGTVTLNNGGLQASVNLSETDVTKVKPGQKVTMTLDAFSGKTFTGKVLTIDTSGAVSSGVTTYPTTLSFDTSLDNIYPNMAVTATIITNIKDNVLLIPSGAVKTQNGQSTVSVLRNNQPVTVDVQVGDSSDTETEITSGLTESDNVITSTTGATTGSTTSTGTSPFSGGLRGGFGGGGAAVTRGRGG